MAAVTVMLAVSAMRARDEAELRRDQEVLARALALRQIGEVDFRKAELEAALEAFVQSRNMAADLAARAPQNNKFLFELSQAEFWVGYVAWQRNDPASATESMRLYRQASQRLAEHEPGNAAYRLAEILVTEGELDRAGKLIEAASRGLAELIEKDPSNSVTRLALGKVEAPGASLAELGFGDPRYLAIEET